MRQIQVIILLLGVFISYSSFGQDLPEPLPKLQDGWKRIFIEDIGSFDLPPKMEIQKGKYREFNVKRNRAIGLRASKVTAQQKGLNKPNGDAFSKYARIIVNTTKGSAGDYEKLDFNISQFSSYEVSQINNLIKQQVQRGFSRTNLKLIKWYPVSIEKINGMSCVHVRYTRRLNDHPQVVVNIYQFHNYDRLHLLTLSYRLSEANYWKDDLKKVLKSFRITNIR